jgi:CheY-like chemotaxis protein
MSEKFDILIIDDEADMCWALTNILTLRGYKACSVTSGKEGAELLKHLYPDVKLIFLDVKLPDINGLELANLIREQYPEIKIVIISGNYYRYSEVVQQGLANGLFDGFIGKPFNVSEIRAALEMSFLL